MSKYSTDQMGVRDTEGRFFLFLTEKSLRMKEEQQHSKRLHIFANVHKN
jgi:hypothetical protein